MYIFGGLDQLIIIIIHDGEISFEYKFFFVLASIRTVVDYYYLFYVQPLPPFITFTSLSRSSIDSLFFPFAFRRWASYNLIRPFCVVDAQFIILMCFKYRMIGEGLRFVKFSGFRIRN